MLNYLVFIFFSTVAPVCRRIKLIKKLLYCIYVSSIGLEAYWAEIKIPKSWPVPHSQVSSFSIYYSSRLNFIVGHR